MTQHHEENVLEHDDLTPEAAAELKSSDTDDALTDEDRELYGKNVQKRIGKEVSKRKREQAARLAAEEKVAAFEQQLAEANRMLNEYKEKEVETGAEREKELTEQRDKALDEGDLSVYSKLNDELLDLKVNRRTQQIIKPAEQHNPAANKQSPAARDWMTDNADWFQKEPEKTNRAIALERQLRREGYKVSDPKLYEKIDEMLEAEFGDTGSGDGMDEELGGEHIDNLDTSASPPTPRDQGDGRRQRTNQSGRMTAGDIANMRKFQLDPNDPVQRKQYMDNKDGNPL